jgi:phosphoglucomutase/phosphopentomutase
VTKNKYFLCYDQVVINQMFDEMRNGGDYFETLGPYKLKSIRDLTTGYDNSQPGNKAVLPTSKATQMVLISFKN